MMHFFAETQLVFVCFFCLPTVKSRWEVERRASIITQAEAKVEQKEILWKSSSTWRREKCEGLNMKDVMCLINHWGWQSYFLWTFILKWSNFVSDIEFTHFVADWLGESSCVKLNVKRCSTEFVDICDNGTLVLQNTPEKNKTKNIFTRNMHHQKKSFV